MTTNWDDYSVDEDALAQREEQLEEDSTSFDAAKQILLPMRWNGTYRGRIMPYPGAMIEQWLMQLGLHYSLFPTGDPNKKTSIDGCPSFTYKQSCPVCEAILKAVMEKKFKMEDFGFKGAGIKLQRNYLVRFLLMGFSPGVQKQGKKAPKFDFENGPLLRVLQIPASVAFEFRKKVADKEDFGFVWLTHPTKGALVKIVRDDSKDPKDQYEVSFPKSEAIPEEFLNTDIWPRLEDYLLPTTTADLMAKIEKHQMDVHPVIANALAIDVAPESRQIEGKSDDVDVDFAGVQEDETGQRESVAPKKSSTLEALRAKVGKKDK